MAKQKKSAAMLERMNEAANAKRKWLFRPFPKGEQKGNGCSARFQKVSFFLVKNERMHSEARTTWSNSFQRPKLSNVKAG